MSAFRSALWIMRYLLTLWHIFLALLWRKPRVLALGSRNLNYSPHTSKVLSVSHWQRLNKEAASSLTDCPGLSLMEYFSVTYSTEGICRDALASCCIISFQGPLSYKVTRIQAGGFALVFQTSWVKPVSGDAGSHIFSINIQTPTSL